MYTLSNLLNELKGDAVGIVSKCEICKLLNFLEITTELIDLDSNAEGNDIILQIVRVMTALER